MGASPARLPGTGRVAATLAGITSIVIVDGHVALREGLAGLLAVHGVEVVGVAGTAAAAVDSVAVGDPDLVLVDPRLPDGDGVKLTRRLLELRPGLGVVLYTGQSDAELLAAGRAAGARGHALKAGSVEELVAAIEQVAAGGTYLDPRLVRRGSAPPAARVPALSPREREVMHLMAEGLTAEKIAQHLGVSLETIRTHVRNAVCKLRARNRVHAIALALERGEIQLDA